MIHAKDIQNNILSYIYSKEFLEKHRLFPKFFTRKRSLSFATVTSLILQKMAKSLQIEANLLGDLMKQPPVSKQALSKARYKIGVSAFQDLHERVLRLHYQDNDQRLWRGYRVFGGDGSTLQLPRQGNIPDFFGDHFSRTCLARIMQYTELTSDLIVSASLMPYRESENAMAKSMLPCLIDKMRGWGHNKQIYVYDRGFPSHAFAQRHLNLGVDFLFRVQKRFSNKILKFVSQKLEGNFETEVKRGKIHYTARVIIRYLESGQPLVLISSLTDKSFIDEDLIHLYQLRWRCEESYKFQKTVLQMDNVPCRSYQGVAQEFWATVMLATLMGISFNEEDEIYAEHKDSYQSTKANRRVIFGSLKSKYLAALLGEIPMSEFNAKFKLLCQRHRVPNKPGRSYPRLSVDTRKTRHCYRRVI